MDKYAGLHSPKGKPVYSGAFRFASFGLELCGVSGLLGYGGYWADQKLSHSWPWLMVIGIAMGFLGVMVLLLKETGHWRK
ncbi:MAG: AtpZ/AtpI family protein [Sedimentisphaerales bacterium]|nr:AtpZ/AtpI family protein [Sedimentisphaerales bacterium]